MPSILIILISSGFKINPRNTGNIVTSDRERGFTFINFNKIEYMLWYFY